jgi:predicted amidohydrolase YtcJ
MLSTLPPQPADLVLRNGVVWTVDPRLPQAQALAVRGNQIVAVGSDAEVDSLVSPATRVIDLAGRLVLPGFNDAHTHLIGAALRAAGAFDLYGVSTLEEVAARLRRHAQQHPDADWLIGWRWDRSRFADSRWPSRADLDAVEAGRPVAVFDIDGHSCWANSAALAALDYHAGSPDPAGGQLLRDAAGHPTGILLETAHHPIPRSAPPAAGEFIPLLRRAVADLNALGITSISNNGVHPDHFEAYARLADDGRLHLRINEWPFLADGLEAPRRLRERFRHHEQIRVIGLKALIDGVLSARTAWMLEPYADAPGETGFPVITPAELLPLALEADALGFQLLIHAIGDRAVRETLDIYQQIERRNGRRERRHRIEHIEVAHPADQARFAELNVVATMTPIHCTACIDAYLNDRLGEPRGAHGYVWRSFVDRGVHLCFGTDWPAVDLAAPDPLPQIYAAVTRTPAGRPDAPPWHPEQRLSVAQAIRAYTLEGAYAEFMDQRKGSLTPGKLADLCVLADNILLGPPGRILETDVALTVFDGEVVYVKE